MSDKNKIDYISKDFEPTKLEEKLQPMYESLHLFHSLYDYGDEDFKTLSDIFLALGSNEAFINFIILFSGRTIKIPEKEKLTFCVRLVCAYNYFIRNYRRDLADTNIIKQVLKKHNIEPTRENINFFKRVDSFLNRI